MFKNMKIGKKISLFVSVLLIIGLVVLSAIVILNLKSSMKQEADDRFSELADARATVVDTYFEGLKGFVSGYAGLDFVKEHLKNPDDEVLFNNAMAQIDSYYATRSGMEGLFTLNTDGVCVVHTNDSVVGAQVIKNAADLSEYQKILTNGPWIKGIAASTAAGELVAVCYSGVYDENRNFLGYVGGGAYITSLTDSLKKMEINGMKSAEVWILNLNADNYLAVPDGKDELLGQPFERELDQRIASEAPSAQRATFDYKDGKENYTVAYKMIPSLNCVVIIEAPESEVMATAFGTAQLIIIISVIILIAMAVLATLIGTTIGKEISSVGAIIKDLGSLNLTEAEQLQPYSGRGDEIGMIADAAITLTGAVRESVQSLTERAEQLKNDSEQLSENTQSTLGSLNQIDKAVHDIAEGATSQSLETQNAANAVASIGGMVENTISSASKLKESAESLQKSSGNAKSILGELSEINDKTKESVNVIYEQTNETNSSAERISEATALISSIASQTNLLSLNASIEAARAGEAGRGFAVVAEEIGQLADQSSESAKQIESIISELVESSKRAVATMDGVRKIMEQQNEYIEKTRDIFADVDKEIGVSLAGITEISGNVKDLDDARRTLADAVSSLSAIAEENAASTEETSASTSVVNEMMGDVSSIANRVSDAAKSIKQDVDVFTI